MFTKVVTQDWKDSSKAQTETFFDKMNLSGNNFTIEFWINLLSYQDYGTVIGQGVYGGAINESSFVIGFYQLIF